MSDDQDQEAIQLAGSAALQTLMRNDDDGEVSPTLILGCCALLIRIAMNRSIPISERVKLLDEFHQAVREQMIAEIADETFPHTGGTKQ